MSDIELSWISGSPYAWRVMLALEVKKLPYTSHVLEASKKQQKSPEFLAINPRGKVPTLRMGDYVVSETMAIIVYLDQKFPKISLLGQSPEEIGTTLRAALEIDTYIAPLITDCINRPIFSGKIDGKIDIIKDAAKDLHGELKTIEANLERRDWLRGDQISAADLTLLPFVEGMLRANAKPVAEQLNLGFLPFEKTYPAISAWRARIHNLERYGETVPLHWRG